VSTLPAAIDGPVGVGVASTSMRTPPRSRPLRVLAASAVAALVLAGCGGDDEVDPALTDAGPVDDVPFDPDAPTDAQPIPDVPGVTEAEPSDDLATTADPDDDVATDEQSAPAQVPALYEAVDGWPETTVTLEGDEPTIVLAKVADAPDRRQQGLMHVEDLPEDVGMLFLFDEPRTGGFWMKDTLVPLDIAYVLGDEVVAVLQMDPCDEDPCPTYDPGVEYDAALEVNQGALEEAGVGEGAAVSWTDPVEVAST
jgi:uncharacterized protein